MGVTVDFDAQANRRAEEIDNRLSFEHDVLSAKFETVELPIGKRPPKAFFGLGRVAAHLLSAPQKFSFGGHRLPHPNPSPEGEGLDNRYFFSSPTASFPNRRINSPISRACASARAPCCLRYSP